MKRKGLIILIAVVAVIGLIIGGFVGSYNSLVEDEEEVMASYSVISTQLERRANLIPNFVSTVQGYSDYEQETFTAVTQARSAVSKADTASQQAEASAELDKAISIWVNAVTEAYPELKANEQYIALQDELTGTENRIARARIDYNDEVREFNSEIRKFPKSIVAAMFGFEKFDYFESSSDAQTVPEVNFD